MLSFSSFHIHHEPAGAFIKVVPFFTGNAVTLRIKSCSIFNFISGKEDRIHSKIDLNSQQIYYRQSQVTSWFIFSQAHKLDDTRNFIKMHTIFSVTSSITFGFHFSLYKLLKGKGLKAE